MEVVLCWRVEVDEDVVARWLDELDTLDKLDELAKLDDLEEVDVGTPHFDEVEVEVEVVFIS